MCATVRVCVSVVAGGWRRRQPISFPGKHTLHETFLLFFSFPNLRLDWHNVTDCSLVRPQLLLSDDLFFLIFFSNKPNKNNKKSTFFCVCVLFNNLGKKQKNLISCFSSVSPTVRLYVHTQLGGKENEDCILVLVKIDLETRGLRRWQVNGALPERRPDVVGQVAGRVVHRLLYSVNKQKENERKL